MQSDSTSTRYTSRNWLIDNVKAHTGNACLLWPFGITAKGYGTLAINRTPQLAHRIAFEIANGRPPVKSVVQTCRNRLCVAPAHLVEHDGRIAPASINMPFERNRWLIEQLASPPSDECWIWPYATAGQWGYGVLITPDHGRQYVHRYVFFLTHGHWPEPETLHSCDNPICFNPRHLSEGTKQENTEDRVRKGRSKGNDLKGEQHGRAKLTNAQVQEIKEKRAAGASRTSLAAEYGVDGRSIWRIVTGRSRQNG